MPGFMGNLMSGLTGFAGNLGMPSGPFIGPKKPNPLPSKDNTGITGGNFMDVLRKRMMSRPMPMNNSMPRQMRPRPMPMRQPMRQNMGQRGRMFEMRKFGPFGL